MGNPAILPGATVLAGKGMSLLYRNPSTGVLSGVLPGELHVDEFQYTPEVDSATYSSSLTSGYKKNTSGIYGAAGRFNILLNSDGSLSSAAGTPSVSPPTAGLGMGQDDFLDIQLYTTLANRVAGTPQLVGIIHIKNLGKAIKTPDQKIAVPVAFDFEGKWVEA